MVDLRRRNESGRSPDGRGLSCAERLEIMSLVAAVGMNECSAWIIPMLDRGDGNEDPRMEKITC